MIEIISAVNAHSFAEVKKKIALVEPHVKWIQLDVADGKFTHWQTWDNAKDLLKLKTSVKIEVHLMIENPETQIKKWLIKPVRRIIFHLEASKNPDRIITLCKKFKIDPGIAIKPDTPWQKLKPFFGKIRFFQILGVNPGKAGQKFRYKVIKKVINIKKHCKNCIIEADGGMKKGIVKKMAKTGVDIIVSASAIFKRTDIKKAIDELKEDAKI